MLTKLELSRFRGFRQIEVGLKPVTVVAGPNSSGKTSILHAVRLACAALAQVLDDETISPRVDGNTVRICSDLVIRDHTRLMRVGEWEEIFTSREVGESITMAITLGFDDASPIQKLQASLTYARNGLPKISMVAHSPAIADVVKDVAKKSKHRPQRIRDALRRFQPIAVLVPAFYGVILTEEYRSKAVASRLLEGGEQSRIVRNLVSRLDPPAFTRLNTFLRRTVSAELTWATPALEAENTERLEVRFRDWDGELELSSAGAGLVNLIALYAALERYRPERADNRTLIFLLDEPEAHLHPKLQGDIGLALAELTREFGAQVIAATHSIEMINRLGQRDDTVLLHMDRVKSSATPLTGEADIVRELSAWCDLSPFTTINFLASRRILFHEGPSDDEVLSRCASAYFRNDDARLRAFRRWTFVPLDGASNADASNILVKVLSSKVFPSLPKGDTVSVVRVLDRDFERKPGINTKSHQPHISETRVVWSRYSIESLFLSPECLAAWITPLLEGVSETQIRTWVEEGIAAANKDQELEDKAFDGLAAVLRTQVQPKEVNPKARELARQEPEIWQQGRARAGAVLAYVRNKLPASMQNKVRSSIPGLLKATPIDKLGSLDVVVPEEIRRLLDLMTKA